MQVLLYQNKSDKLEVTKSIDLVATKSCELKEDTSIITPTFLLSGGVDDYADVNYVYVADFLRYYYTPLYSLARVLTAVTEKDGEPAAEAAQVEETTEA